MNETKTYPKMDPEWKAKWIEALRSGTYEQGQGALRRDHFTETGRPAYCCMGVLCDIVDPAAWRKLPDGEAPVDCWIFGSGIESWAYPPGAVCDKTGLQPLHANELGKRWGACLELGRLNDGSGPDPSRRQHTFAEIADWIEANL